MRINKRQDEYRIREMHRRFPFVTWLLEKLALRHV